METDTVINRCRILFRLTLSLACMGLGIIAPCAHAQSAYPNKAVRLVVPYTAGGITDSLARALAERMRTHLGQPVIVENRPGANTALAAKLVSTAEPDGYTVLFATGATAVLNPLLYPKLSYDPDKELAPVARIALTPMIMVVGGKSPYKTLRELITAARDAPAKLNYGSTGTGSSPHLASEMLQQEAGISILHVPYNGSSPVHAALMSGDIQFAADPAGSAMALAKSGKLHPVAVTSKVRLSALPDVPTVAESGYPNFEVTTWFGLMVPKKAPDSVVQRLNAAVAAAGADPEFQKQFEALGMVIPKPLSSTEFSAYIAHERAAWEPLIRAKKIVLE
jgi:tripartite-type tricarboxylate transporter receptor subunit TctC